MSLRAEFHCHTDYSMDGLMSVEVVSRTAQRLGLDVVAITDHDEIEGAFALERLVKSTGVQLEVIIGEERTLDDGSHLIGLFLKEKIASSKFEDVVAEVYAQGGLCVVPHPFRKSDGLFREELEERVAYLRSKPAGYEWQNAKCSRETNQRAVVELTGCGLAAFGGSDAHYDSDVGQCEVKFDRPIGLDLHDCVERMFSGQLGYSILGKRQLAGDGERRYAPWYYAIRDYVRVPKPALPIAKQAYRCYRNLRYGIGREPLTELYASE
jgi:hypothetical protein